MSKKSKTKNVAATSDSVVEAAQVWRDQRIKNPTSASYGHACEALDKAIADHNKAEESRS